MRARITRQLALPDVRFALLAFLVGRVVVSLLAVIGWQLPHDPPEPAPHWAAQPPAHAWQAAFTGLEHYDAQWYLQIASDGYGPGDPSSAFFPLYPLLVRAVGVLVGGHWLLAATLVSNAALVVALVLLQRLTARELSPDLARPVVVLLLCSPVAFFLYAPYTESLFLALMLACLLQLRAGHWGWAALAAALASATRSTGALLGLVMAVEALRLTGWGPRDRASWALLLRRWAWSCIAGAGVAAYLLYWQLRGNRHAPTQALHWFGREGETPWSVLWHGARKVVTMLDNPVAFPFNVESLLGFGALALGAVAVKRYAPPYKVLVLASLSVPLLLVIPQRPLTSIARYDLVVFPLFWALAELTRRRVVRLAVLASSATLLGFLTVLFASWHDVL